MMRVRSHDDKPWPEDFYLLQQNLRWFQIRFHHVEPAIRPVSFKKLGGEFGNELFA
jgi:hypothetical protein